MASPISRMKPGQAIIEKIIRPVLMADRADLLRGELVMIPPGRPAPNLGEFDVACHINPTGCFLTGGPHGDCGLTGRKIIVDTYGGRGRHGGGAFSGKDPTKVDRSAAYVCRYIAKNIVKAGLARQCEVQLSYASGYPDPLNIWVNPNGTAKVPEATLVGLIREYFRLTPKGIIDTHRPCRRADLQGNGASRSLLAAGTPPTFSCGEAPDRADMLRKAAGV